MSMWFVPFSAQLPASLTPFEYSLGYSADPYDSGLPAPPSGIHFSAPLPVVPLIMSVDIYEPSPNGTVSLTDDLAFQVQAFSGTNPASVSTPLYLGFGEGLTVTDTVQRTVNSFGGLPSYPPGTMFAVVVSGPSLGQPVAVGGSVVFRAERFEDDGFARAENRLSGRSFRRHRPDFLS